LGLFQQNQSDLSAPFHLQCPMDLSAQSHLVHRLHLSVPFHLQCPLHLYSMDLWDQDRPLDHHWVDQSYLSVLVGLQADPLGLSFHFVIL
jgi:hypothetical protein